MNCKDVQEQIYTYLDNETSPSEKRLIQAHLTGCKDCQSELEAADTLGRGLRQHFQTRTVTVAPSAGAWLNLQAALPSQPPKGSGAGWLGGSIPNEIRFSGLRLSVARLAILMVIMGMMAVAAPPVWARLEPLIVDWFSFSSPDGENFTAIGGFDAFTPYHAAYVPEGFESSLLGTLTGEGIESIEIGYAERVGGFITLVQSKGSAVAGLPAGEITRVGAKKAILIRSFATSAVEMQAMRPEISIVSNYNYSEVNYLAWFDGEIKIEIFSNQPFTEMMKVAESLEPMQPSQGEVPYFEGQ